MATQEYEKIDAHRKIDDFVGLKLNLVESSKNVQLANQFSASDLLVRKKRVMATAKGMSVRTWLHFKMFLGGQTKRQFQAVID